MAISRAQKKQMVADYVDRMSRSQALILADYRGLTVANMTELRQKLRETDGIIQVVKNTLIMHKRINVEFAQIRPGVFVIVDRAQVGTYIETMLNSTDRSRK